MTLLDRILLLATGLAAIYALWLFYGAYQKTKALHYIYYMLGFGVLLVSGLLLIFLGWGILVSPYVLIVSSLIPLGLSLGIANQYYPGWKKIFRLVRAGRLAGNCVYIPGCPGSEEGGGTAVPWCSRVDHLPRADLRREERESSQGILVGLALAAC